MTMAFQIPTPTQAGFLSVPTAVAYVNNERFIRANSRMEEIIGVSADQLNGVSFNQYMFPEFPLGLTVDEVIEQFAKKKLDPAILEKEVPAQPASKPTAATPSTSILEDVKKQMGQEEVHIEGLVAPYVNQKTNRIVLLSFTTHTLTLAEKIKHGFVRTAKVAKTSAIDITPQVKEALKLLKEQEATENLRRGLEALTQTQGGKINGEEMTTCHNVVCLVIDIKGYTASSLQAQAVSEAYYQRFVREKKAFFDRIYGTNGIPQAKNLPWVHMHKLMGDGIVMLTGAHPDCAEESNTENQEVLHKRLLLTLYLAAEIHKLQENEPKIMLLDKAQKLHISMAAGSLYGARPEGIQTPEYDGIPLILASRINPLSEDGSTISVIGEELFSFLVQQGIFKAGVVVREDEGTTNIRKLKGDLKGCSTLKDQNVYLIPFSAIQVEALEKLIDPFQQKLRRDPTCKVVQRALIQSALASEEEAAPPCSPIGSVASSAIIDDDSNSDVAASNGVIASSATVAATSLGAYSPPYSQKAPPPSGLFFPFHPTNGRTKSAPTTSSPLHRSVSSARR